MPAVNRRSLLKVLSLAPIATCGIVPLWAQKAAAEAGLVSDNVCLVSPELTEGPYYIDPKLIRADITEGKQGAALALTLQVVNETCSPLANARVDIWHCDAEGNYSGFAGQGGEVKLDTEGQTFLRGTLFTDDLGLVRFNTIYPGWYRGRTSHIHYMVYLDETTVLTSQIFFAENTNAEVYAGHAPYNQRSGSNDTTNARDGIARQAGDGAYASVKAEGAGYMAAMVVGVAA